MEVKSLIVVLDGKLTRRLRKTNRLKCRRCSCEFKPFEIVYSKQRTGLWSQIKYYCLKCARYVGLIGFRIKISKSVRNRVRALKLLIGTKELGRKMGSMSDTPHSIVNNIIRNVTKTMTLEKLMRLSDISIQY